MFMDRLKRLTEGAVMLTALVAVSVAFSACRLIAGPHSGDVRWR